MSLDLPHVLAGRYELIERLGGGGMGDVYRARDQVLERIVAVKTTRNTSQDPTDKERFRREAVATAGLSDPHVVSVYDAGFDGDLAFIVMELLTGPSLHQALKENGPAPLQEGVRVLDAVTRGLMAAHAVGVVHRDIKPGNIMYHDDQIKIVDFGIAQLADSEHLTATHTAMGTAAYMSPEQASGQGATAASDMYALGCVMMTMFTGKPPFQGEAISVATQQITAEPPRLAERRADLPPALSALIDGLLRKDPQERPTADQLLEACRQLTRDPYSANAMNAVTMALPAAGIGGTGTQLLPPESVGQPVHQPTPIDAPTSPFAPVPAPAPAPVAEYSDYAPEEQRKKGRGGLWAAAIIVLLLALGGGTWLMLGMPGIGGAGDNPSASPAPTATRTQEEPSPTQTRQQEPTRAPTTRSAPTTQAPTRTQTTRTTQPETTTSRPTPSTETSTPATGNDNGETGNDNGQTGNDNGQTGNGNSGNGDGQNYGEGVAQARQTLSQIGDPGARTVLQQTFENSLRNGSPERAMKDTLTVAKGMRQVGAISEDEYDALDDALDD